MGYQNFFATKLYTDVGAADTTITLETPPTATSGRLVLEARNATQREIIKYTGVSGNQITGVTRGQGGTTAKTHLKNALVEMNAVGEDLQDLYDAFNSFSGSNGAGWNSMVTLPNTVSYLGNRQYLLTWLGSNQTNLIGSGTRLKSTRTTAAPTQSTLLNGTTQYWSKTSPNKLTFTDDFVVSAWVKLTAYNSSAAQSIVSRFNNTSGWNLTVETSGQIQLAGFNASSSNYSLVKSYQSIPLNKWVHITAQLDMSAFTATTTTSYVMLDGVDVPASVTRAGTNPTALVQAGDLQVGAGNGTGFFPGEIAQVVVFNAKVPQATMQNYISQGLLGTEPNVASAWSFNGVATDLMTTTPNNLTANGAAGYTADAPFGTQSNGSISSTIDFGTVQSATFSTDTTAVVSVLDGNTIPTVGTLAALAYSNMYAPLGYPTRGLVVSPQVTNTYMFGAYLATAQGIANGANSKIQFDAKLFDTNNNFDVITNKGRYTAPLTGVYQFNASVTFGAINGNAGVTMGFYKNGTLILQSMQIENGTPAWQPQVFGSGLLQLNAGDYLEVFLFNGDSVGRNAVPGQAFTYFQGFLVSR